MPRDRTEKAEEKKERMRKKGGSASHPQAARDDERTSERDSLSYQDGESDDQPIY